MTPHAQNATASANAVFWKNWRARVLDRACSDAHLPGVILALLGRPTWVERSSSEWRYGRKGSLKVTMGGDLAGCWFNFESGQGGGLTRLVEIVHGFADFRDAYDWLAGQTNADPSPTPNDFATHGPARARRTPEERAEAARNRWNPSRPIIGTIAERYLMRRGIDVSRCPEHVRTALARGLSLRFNDRAYCSETSRPVRALVSAWQMPDGTVRAIQEIYLNPDGTRPTLVVPKRTTGPADPGGCVMLAKGDPTRWAIAEGIENLLSVSPALADWTLAATWGTSGLRAFTAPPGVTTLLIVADNDPPSQDDPNPGHTAAKWCALRQTNTTDVRIAMPPHTGDWNDLRRKMPWADLCALFARTAGIADQSSGEK